MHYVMDETDNNAAGTSAYAPRTDYPKLDSKPDSAPVIKESGDDYVEIQRADIEPVYYCDIDLNDVVFTVLKALQNASKQRFYSENVLADILCGTESEKVVKNRLGQIPEFRALKEMPYDTVQAIVEWMISQHYILKTKERYPVLHSTYDGLHYSESITKGKLQKLKKYLEEDVVLWK